jgi:hypothetical protein
VSDCLQKRKSALAQELLVEVAPVVGGEGRLDDHTTQGWGLVIDTIEIQEVRVMSEKVFADMQAPYRAALEREAREAKAHADKIIQKREVERDQEVEEARLNAARLIAEQKNELAKQDAEEKRERALRQADTERVIVEKQVLAKAAVEKKKQEVLLDQVEMKNAERLHIIELEKREAEAKVAAHEAQLLAIEKQSELEAARGAVDKRRREQESALMLLEGQRRAEAEKELAQAQAIRSEAEAQLKVAERLPDLAAAVGQRFGEVKVVQVGGEGNPFGQVADALGSVLKLVRPDKESA